MILDSNAIFVEGTVATAANYKTVEVGFDYAGRVNMALYLAVTETVSGTLTMKLQEADSETGTYTDVAGGSIVLSGDDLKVGVRSPMNYLPANVKKAWLKLVPSGNTALTGSIICGLVRELDQPYATGLYIDKGVVQG